MRSSRPAAIFAALLFSVPALGDEEIQLVNWTAPPYWIPTTEAAPKETGIRSVEKGPATSRREVLAVPTPALAFTGIAPCRVADTRGGSAFPAGFGPPSLVGGGAPRTFAIPAGPCPGLPASAGAWSLNFTVVAPPGTPPGGYLTVWPAGGTQPIVSTLNFTSNSILANAAVVPAGTSGGINVFVNFSTDLIIDVNGYYAPPQGAFSHLLAVGAIAPNGSKNTVFTNLGTWTSSNSGIGSYSITFPGLNPGCVLSFPTIQLTADQSGFVFFTLGSTPCLSGDTTMVISRTSSANVAQNGGFFFSMYGPSPVASPLAPAIEGRTPTTCTYTASTGVLTCE